MKNIKHTILIAMALATTLHSQAVISIPGNNDINKGASPDMGVVESPFTTSQTSPPEAPDGLSADAVSATRINLSWNDNADNESGFVVERSINPGIAFEEVVRLPANTTAYNDSLLTESTRYTYRVYAFNDLGNSPPSNEAEAITDSVHSDGRYFVQDATAGNHGLIVFEAEHYDAKVNKSGMSFLFTQQPEGYSGKGLMVVLPDTGFRAFGKGDWPADWVEVSPRLDYNINVLQAGRYYIWLRTNTRDSWTKDSWHAGIDGQRNTTAANINTHGPEWGWYNTSKWIDGNDTRAYIDIAQAGAHVFNLWVREDGAPIDKILLTNDPDYTPSGIGPDESERGDGAVRVLDRESRLPQRYELYQNYPNPFNPTTHIVYELPERGLIDLSVYDVRGVKVATLFSGVQSAGRHTVQWRAENHNGIRVAIGIYLLRLQAGDFSKTVALMFIK